MTSVRCKIRHILSDYNADRKDLFSSQSGPAYFKEVALSDADRFVIKQLWSEYEDHQGRLLALTKKIKAFVAKAPKREAEARAIIMTAPGVGTVTAEVVLSELAEVSRFKNAKAICAYAGLVGRENVIASADCGFSSRATFSPEVHPTVVWAKFAALAEGAAIATKRLWEGA